MKLAVLDVLIATPIGVLLALGLARWRGRGSGASNFLMLFPLVTPEIVMGVSLLLLFTQLLTFVHTGTAGPGARPRHLLDQLRGGDRARPAVLDRAPVRGGGADLGASPARRCIASCCRC